MVAVALRRGLSADFVCPCFARPPLSNLDYLVVYSANLASTLIDFASSAGCQDSQAESSRSHRTVHLASFDPYCSWSTFTGDRSCSGPTTLHSFHCSSNYSIH